MILLWPFFLALLLEPIGLGIWKRGGSRLFSVLHIHYTTFFSLGFGFRFGSDGLFVEVSATLW